MIREVVTTNNQAGDERRILKKFAEGWNKNYGREGGMYSPAFKVGDPLTLLDPEMIDGSCYGMEPYVNLCSTARFIQMVIWRPHSQAIGEPGYEKTPREWMEGPFQKYMREQYDQHGAMLNGWLVNEIETCFAVLNDRKTTGCNFFNTGAELVALHDGVMKVEPFHKFTRHIDTIKVGAINAFGVPQVFEVALDAVVKKA